jgi:hypothetical protein
VCVFPVRSITNEGAQQWSCRGSGVAWRLLLFSLLPLDTSQHSISMQCARKLLQLKHSLTLSEPTSDLVRQYDFPVLFGCRKMSDTAFVAFVRPLSEPVRRFSSCSTDFSQQIAQVVLFLYLHAFLFYNCRIITSNSPSKQVSKEWSKYVCK